MMLENEIAQIAISVENGEAVLTWHFTDTKGTSFDIYHKIGGDGTYEVLESVTDVTQYNAGVLAPGVNFFKIKQNGGGYSPEVFVIYGASSFLEELKGALYNRIRWDAGTGCTAVRWANAPTGKDIPEIVLRLMDGQGDTQAKWRENMGFLVQIFGAEEAINTISGRINSLMQEFTYGGKEVAIQGCYKSTEGANELAEDERYFTHDIIFLLKAERLNYS